MERSPASTAGAVLQALADLSPSTEQRPPGLAVPTEWFRWLPIDAVRLMAPDPRTVMERTVVRAYSQGFPEGAQPRAVAIDRHFGERLAAVDQIRAEQRSLRVGWLFVAGRMRTEEGRARRVFRPLVTIPVRVERPPAFGAARLVPAGDAEISELVVDHDVRHELASHIELGGGALEGYTEVEAPSPLLARLDRLQHFARSVAVAAGLPATAVVPATGAPDDFMRADELVIVAGVGVYAIREAGESSRASSLRAWAAGGLDDWTSFHQLYLDSASPLELEPGARESVESPFLLTPIQRQAVARSRYAPITLVSGAPGTGKSHTVAAIACDALGRGQRVLVAAKSDASVDALLDLLERAPGPDPVVFGSNERREALATRLSAGQLQPEGDEAVSSARQSFDASAVRRDELRMRVVDELGAELLVTEVDVEATAARARAPGLFAPDVDLRAADVALGTVVSPARGWLGRRRQRKAQQRLVLITQAPRPLTASEVSASLRVARAAHAAVALRDQGGLELGSLWDQLLAADDAARDACGRWLAADGRSHRRLNRSALAAVAGLATALRSGRSARRDQLARLDGSKLTLALPLWVGTLGDVDDLLPPTAALFDLVILDEASSIDQPLAATALLRGRRAVIAGDSRQLRQVSFVSDAQLRTVMKAHGLDDAPALAARCDVRRNSAFDVAAGATSVLVLDEHFRSDPHLVDFVLRRLYDGEVKVATRSPRTQSRDCIDVQRTEGRRDAGGVVRAEVEGTTSELRALLRAGVRSVGVVTPFRAQADALEEAVLGTFSADDLEALDLRVGTVHALQGNERDVIIASLGIGQDEGGSSWRFVEDQHLFAVLTTRARRRMTVIYSADPPAGGLVAAYLAQADTPPGRPRSAGPVGPWSASVAVELTSAGVPVVTAYPTGRHVVDICIDNGRRDLGIECEVHPDGPDAHIDQHMALARRGWELVEAYRSRWADHRTELVVGLVGVVQSGRPARDV